MTASFALSLDEFIAEKTNAPAPLIGTADDCVLPAHGLLLLIGKGGKGKTTTTNDAIFHLASGRDWLGWAVSRPLRILLVENEGPREPFRRKLERRRAAWPHPITGAIFVYAEKWGQASLKDDEFVERLNAYVAENSIDLIVGDPLDSLGMEGNGTPEQTRDMVDRFKAAGLFSSVAWWVLHHSRKEKVTDAIDEAAGAWGGRPDAMLGLEKLDGSRSRLGFSKLRWGRRDGFSYLLAYEPDTEGLSLIEEEGAEDRDLVADIEKLLADGIVRTLEEIRQPTDKGGIGAAKDAVKAALEGNPDRFVSHSGEAAKALGRRSNSTVYELARGQKLVELVDTLPGLGMAQLASSSPRRELDAFGLDPGELDELAPTPELDAGDLS